MLGEAQSLRFGAFRVAPLRIAFVAFLAAAYDVGAASSSFRGAHITAAGGPDIPSESGSATHGALLLKRVNTVGGGSGSGAGLKDKTAKKKEKKKQEKVKEKQEKVHEKQEKVKEKQEKVKEKQEKTEKKGTEKKGKTSKQPHAYLAPPFMSPRSAPLPELAPSLGATPFAFLNRTAHGVHPTVAPLVTLPPPWCGNAKPDEYFHGLGAVPCYFLPQTVQPTAHPLDPLQGREWWKWWTTTPAPKLPATTTPPPTTTPAPTTTTGFTTTPWPKSTKLPGT